MTVDLILNLEQHLQTGPHIAVASESGDGVLPDCEIPRYRSEAIAGHQRGVDRRPVWCVQIEQTRGMDQSRT